MAKARKWSGYALIDFEGEVRSVHAAAIPIDDLRKQFEKLGWTYVPVEICECPTTHRRDGE